MTLEAGLQPIPGFRLTRPLGAGAFGDVWEAQREDSQSIALKFIDCRKNTASSVANEVRLLRALAELQHPNIIPINGIHASSRYIVVAMERADGNLADLHAAYREETGGNMPPGHALELLEQAASALDYLATVKLAAFPALRGLQHCDIKPSNLLLVGNQLKVTDFGLCSGTGWVTHHNSWRGTLPYAAPELYNGAATTGTDQYALAVTFCELVMGDRPFWKNRPADQGPSGIPIDLTKIRENEFPIISRALHPYPSSRWPSCRAFIQALRKVAEPPRRGSSVKIFPRGLRGTLRQRRLEGNLTDTWQVMMGKSEPKASEPHPAHARR